MELKTIVSKDSLAENTYVITEGENALIIDPGKAEGNDNQLMTYLEDKNIKKITVFLTHGDYDHIGSLPELQSKYDFIIYLDSMERITNFNKNLFKLCNQDQAEYLKLINVCENVEDIFEWNNHKFRVITVPGHTAGSIMLEVDELKAYFSGDFLFKDDIGYVRENDPSSTPKMMKESLNKLKSLKQDYTVYPGHGEPTNMGYEVKNNYYVNNPLESWSA